MLNSVVTGDLRVFEVPLSYIGRLYNTRPPKAYKSTLKFFHGRTGNLWPKNWFWSIRLTPYLYPPTIWQMRAFSVFQNSPKIVKMPLNDLLTLEIVSSGDSPLNHWEKLNKTLFYFIIFVDLEQKTNVTVILLAIAYSQIWLIFEMTSDGINLWSLAILFSPILSLKTQIPSQKSQTFRWWSYSWTRINIYFVGVGYVVEVV